MFIVRNIDGYTADADLFLSIGVFDGVHAGHRLVLDRLMRHRRPGAIVGAMTFERHPQDFFHPGKGPKSITTVEEKVNLLDGCGLDVLFLLPFDERIQLLSAEEFLNELLIQRLRTRMLVVGERWRFGKDRTGDCEVARRVLQAVGCAFEATPLLERNGEKVSSSHIRDLIKSHAFGEADSLLGTPFTIRGCVRSGEGRGHRLGYPTANLDVAADKLLPPHGVYAATARYDGTDYTAVVSIGDKPTFGGSGTVVEAYLIDFHLSIYGDQLVLRELQFLRDQRRYDSPEALVAQMHRDIEAARQLHIQ